MNIIDIGGERYVKASDAAKRFGYTTDYIGQLVRAGKISGQQIGRTWYVKESDLTGHKTSKGRSNRQKTKEAFHRAVAETPHEHAIYNSLVIPSSERSVPEYRRRLLESQVHYEHDSNPLMPQPETFEVPARPLAVKDVEEVVEVEKLGKTLSITKIDPALAILEPTEPVEPPMHGTVAVRSLESDIPDAETEPAPSIDEAEAGSEEPVVAPARHPSRFEERLQEQDEVHQEPAMVPMHRALPIIPPPSLGRRRALSLGPRITRALVPVTLLLMVTYSFATVFLEQVMRYEQGSTPAEFTFEASYAVSDIASVRAALSR